MEEEAGAGGPSGLTSGVWVPLGSCKRAPEKYHASAEEMQKARNKVAMLAAEAGDEAEDVPMEGGEEEGEENKVDEAAEEEEDDEESDESEGANLEIPLQGADVQNIESDDESELNDLQVMPDDMVFLCAHQRTNGSSTLEVYVYDDEHENVYLHHDIMLPAIPLCVAWASSGRKKDGTAVEGGSFAAVTTFLPFIEVWDLDIIDAPDPAITLGGCKRPSDNYRAKNLTASSLKKNSHKDSVLCARWNPGVKKVLASGSADNTVKLWDLHTGENLLTATHHQVCGRRTTKTAKKTGEVRTGLRIIRVERGHFFVVTIGCRLERRTLTACLGGD
ncbi:putative WD repeat-containing protein C17D11.16 [Diplonema papillatum]|nr:putative WD repeat-containing protein C17D11.16 [Diplonema papillatum]